MSLLPLLFVAAVFVALANGANDNFKGVATLHGSGTLSYRHALVWATVTTLAGSLSAVFLSGGLVARFSGEELVPDSVVAEPAFLFSVALGVAGTVLLATRLGFPISTTHALTGGLLGAGMVLAGPASLSYQTLGVWFALPLMFSPLLSMGLSAGVYRLFRGARRALEITEETCVCIGGVEQMATYVPGSGMVRLATGLTVSVDSVERCERRYAGNVLGIDAQTLLKCLHVVTGGAVGFARGLNDAPKILALLAVALAPGLGSGMILTTAMALGGLLAARRVARTMSFRITGMNHGQAFAANLVTAALVTLASPLGLPVSTTHVACGALFGIGAMNGEARWGTIVSIVMAWVTTAPMAAILSATVARLTIVFA